MDEDHRHTTPLTALAALFMTSLVMFRPPLARSRLEPLSATTVRRIHLACSRTGNGQEGAGYVPAPTGRSAEEDVPRVLGAHAA